MTSKQQQVVIGAIVGFCMIAFFPPVVENQDHIRFSCWLVAFDGYRPSMSAVAFGHLFLEWFIFLVPMAGWFVLVTYPCAEESAKQTVCTPAAAGGEFYDLRGAAQRTPE
jgi:hypothetical protein